MYLLDSLLSGWQMLGLSENQCYQELHKSYHRGDQKKLVTFLNIGTLERNLQLHCLSD